MTEGFHPWRGGTLVYEYADAYGGIYTMAHIYTPKCMQVTLRGRDSEGNLLLNVFHCTTPGAGVTETDLEHATTATVNMITTNYVPLVHATIAFVDVTAIALDVPEPAPKHVAPIATVGTRVGKRLPGGSTLSLVKNCNTTGRTARGALRVFPACVDDLSVGNEFTDAYITEAVAAFEALRTGIEAAGLALVVRSVRANKTTPVTSFLAPDNTVDSQKTRLAGRGK